MKKTIHYYYLFIVILGGMIVISGCNEKKDAHEKPNILFLFADDQRAGTIHALGNSEIITPNLDKLTEEGIVFPNAYIMGGSSAAVCAPSRAMLMTGRNLYSIEKQGWRADISGKYETMPETFRKAGYITYGTGKQHNGRGVYARGFSDGDEIFFGGMYDHWNIPLYHFDTTGRYDKKLPYCPAWDRSNKLKYRNADHIVSGTHSCELFSDAAISFLNNYDGKRPFFMYVSYTTPHDPRTMPERFRKMYDTASVSVPSSFLTQHPFDQGDYYIRDEKLAKFPRSRPEIKQHIIDYYAMITYLDEEIGRIIDVLKNRGLYKNTIVVFSGDNGLAVGQHGLMGKQNIYECSVNVPLIFSGKGIPVNKKCNTPVYLFDIYPSLCDMAGLEASSSVQGRSFKDFILNDESDGQKVMFYGYKEYQRAVRSGNFKLIEYYVDNQRHTQLFDLSNDRMEINNIAGKTKYKPVLDSLQHILFNSRISLNDTGSFWQGYKEYIDK